MADEAFCERFCVLARDAQEQQHFQNFVIGKGLRTVGFDAGAHPGTVSLGAGTACQVDPGR